MFNPDHSLKLGLNPSRGKFHTPHSVNDFQYICMVCASSIHHIVISYAIDTHVRLN